MKVLMVGRYPPGGYLRGDILRKGLQKNSVDVEIFLGRGKFKYLQIAKRVLKNDYDFLFATGTITFLVSRLFARKPVIFDAFISNYDTMVYDRKLVKEGSLKSRLYWLGDKYCCRLSYRAIFDTEEHKQYFIEEFGLQKDAEKFREIPVGADDEVFFPAEGAKSEGGAYTVLFYGNFIPVHGIKYIIMSAKLLEGEADIRFRILGSGQTLAENKKFADDAGLKNTEFASVQVDKDPQKHMGGADVCLGIFGDTKKAKRVVATKAYQIIAMKKPLITGDCPAARRVFKDGENAVLCKMADARAIADAVLLLRDDPALREKVAEGGYALYSKKYTPAHLGRQLKEMLAG